VAGVGLVRRQSIASPNAVSPGRSPNLGRGSYHSCLSKAAISERRVIVDLIATSLLAIGVWRSVMPSWAVMAAVCEAEPSVERSAADCRAAA
jgi:hypothetical protein